MLANEGELQIIEDHLKNGTSRYVRLGVGLEPPENAILGDITEVSGSGYAVVEVEGSAVGWPTVALDSGDYMATSKSLTFTATGTWTEAAFAYLATTSDDTGRLLSAVDLAASKTLGSGDVMIVTFNLKVA